MLPMRYNKQTVSTRDYIPGTRCFIAGTKEKTYWEYKAAQTTRQSEYIWNKARIM